MGLRIGVFVRAACRTGEKFGGGKDGWVWGVRGVKPLSSRRFGRARFYAMTVRILETVGGVV